MQSLQPTVKSEKERLKVQSVSKVDVVCHVSQDIPTYSSCCCTCCSFPERFWFPKMWQSRRPEAPKPSTPTAREGADFRNHSAGWQRNEAKGASPISGVSSASEGPSQLFLFTCRLNPDFCVSTSDSTIPLSSAQLCNLAETPAFIRTFCNSWNEDNLPW